MLSLLISLTFTVWIGKCGVSNPRFALASRRPCMAVKSFMWVYYFERYEGMLIHIRVLVHYLCTVYV